MAVEDGAVLAVGHPARLDGLGLGAVPETDLGAAILVPGFVDAHCHLEWSLMGGLVDPAAGFGAWLGGFLGFLRRLPPGLHAAAARLGALRALRAGTTTVADSGPTGAGVAALGEAGLRGIVHLEAFGSDPAAAAPVAGRVADLAAAASPLVRVGVSPHAPYTAGPALWSALEAAGPFAGWATHLAESADETRVLASGDGPIAEALAVLGFAPARWPGDAETTPVGRAVLAGTLRPGLVAAHCVHLGPGDAESLAAADVRVAHCPVSNAHLACGRSPLERLRAAGVVVALGTDSPASAGAYDLRAEARAAAVAHGAATGSPPPARELVRMMTEAGAEALGMAGIVGALAPGARADIVAVRPGPEMRGGDPHAAILHETSAIDAVWVDGEPLLADGLPTRIDAAGVVTGAAEARSPLC